MNEIDKMIKEQNCSLMCDTVRQIVNERNRFESRAKELEEKLKIAESQMKLARDIAYDSSQSEPVRVQIDEILTQALKQIEEVK